MIFPESNVFFHETDKIWKIEEKAAWELTMT